MPATQKKESDPKLCRVIEELERGNRIAAERLAESKRTNVLLERIAGGVERLSPLPLFQSALASLYGEILGECPAGSTWEAVYGKDAISPAHRVRRSRSKRIQLLDRVPQQPKR